MSIASKKSQMNLADCRFATLPIIIGKIPVTRMDFIRIRDCEVIGSVSLKHEAKRIAEMSWLFVRKEERDQGIGRRLVNECALLARASGCTSLNLRIESHNRGVENFYIKQGFHPAYEWGDGDTEWTKALKCPQSIIDAALAERPVTTRAADPAQ